MTTAERIDRLDQRRRYLEKRVQAKKEMGWNFDYDDQERESLEWILKLHYKTQLYLQTVPQGDA